MSIDTSGDKTDRFTVQTFTSENSRHEVFNNSEHKFKRNQSFGFQGHGGHRDRRFNNRMNVECDGRRPRFHRGQFGQGDHPNLYERLMLDKLRELSGSTYELPIIESREKKYSGRCRLYIGNLPNELTEEELMQMFKAYGDISEFFMNKEKNFAFLKLDYHFNAEKAKNELNGTVVKGRNLKIRFAPNNGVVKVKNLDEHVSNELLHTSFSVFGDIERCIVIVDDRGKSVGEGIVEFAKKGSAQYAIRKCRESCFYITSKVQPVFVELHTPLDELNGYPEKFLKKTPEYFQNRSVGPRFAPPCSFDNEYGMRWKQLNEMYNEKFVSLKNEVKLEQEKLIAQMGYAHYQYETAMLRNQLHAREIDMNKHKQQWEMTEHEVEEVRRNQQKPSDVSQFESVNIQDNSIKKQNVLPHDNIELQNNDTNLYDPFHNNEHENESHKNDDIASINVTDFPEKRRRF